MDDTNSKWALIVAGGKPVQSALLSHLGEPTWVVAADSGLDQAYRLGLTPDLVIGDMDSVTPEALHRAEQSGVDIEKHPVAKDATDLELAIAAAERNGFTRGTIIGGTGGRIAHTLGNTMLLIKPRPIRLNWKTERATIAPIQNGEARAFSRDDGPLLSVLAACGLARCESSGLRWPLHGIALEAGSTRGLSNEITAETARVTVTSGQVLTVHERN